MRIFDRVFRSKSGSVRSANYTHSLERIAERRVVAVRPMAKEIYGALSKGSPFSDRGALLKRLLEKWWAGASLKLSRRVERPPP